MRTNSLGDFLVPQLAIRSVRLPSPSARPFQPLTLSADALAHFIFLGMPRFLALDTLCQVMVQRDGEEVEDGLS